MKRLPIIGGAPKITKINYFYTSLWVGHDKSK